MHDQLVSLIFYLMAALIAVPLFVSLRLGAILGYLAAGVMIGPGVLGLIDNPEATLHLAELGVVLLLFLIGLELSPQALWRMRNWIALLGSGQLGITTLVICGSIWLFTDLAPSLAVLIGLALALSSTAFAVQLMNNYRLMASPVGRRGFAILLTQDLAVIPILLFAEVLAGAQGETTGQWYLGVGAMVAAIVISRFLLNPALRLVSNTGGQELMTAAALLIVFGMALLAEAAGLSMGLGAFIAGILLANSSFRHQLEVEVEPFKGLLLGLFFIAVGMSLDINLLIEQPLLIVGLATLLVIVKAGIITGLLKASGSDSVDALRMAIILSQGGEFAFVVLSQSLATGVVSAELANLVSLTVGVSMAMTAPLLMLFMRIAKLRAAQNETTPDIEWESEDPAVIIAGFGRFGQITGRILAANGIRFTALDKDAAHIEFVRRFGNKVYFGDATRIELLERAGIDHARVVLVGVDDEEEALEIVALVRREYPEVKIISRAHNRFNLLKHHEAGADHTIREMFHSSLEAAVQVLCRIGITEERARKLAGIFADHDLAMINEAKAHPVELEHLIEIGMEGRKELESLFSHDKGEQPAP